VNHESTMRVERAGGFESTKVRERAKKNESNIRLERASWKEGTEGCERAC
jgi:hypothetical protein